MNPVFCAGDPLDNRYADLGNSEAHVEAGEGIFAKTLVPKNNFFTLFGGRFYDEKDFKSLVIKSDREFRSRNITKSHKEFEDFWKYRYISL